MGQATKIALKISIIYIFLGVLWIIITDYISVSLYQNDFDRFIGLQQSKGWFFIVLSGISVFFTVLYWIKKLLNSTERLQVKDEQYRSLFLHNPYAVVEFNRQGQILSVNPSAKEVFGYNLNFLTIDEAENLMQFQGEAKVSVFFNQAINKENIAFETSFLHPDGEERIILCSLFPIINQGECIGLYLIARDITKARREEEHLIMNEKTSVIGHLAAAVAHEIRNPLTSLKGFIQLMKSTKEINDDYIDIILKEIERINIISGELLILGKKQELTYQRLDIQECIRQVFTLMKAQTNLDNVELYFNENGPPVYIMGDETQMKQMLINLIKNSIESIKDCGNIEVALTTEKEHAMIRVMDNGVGISPERLERMGELFYSTKEEGTGIGLAVSQKIIQRHKGQIHFRSELNKGTTVIIQIPLAIKDEK